jgi:hypothetical protein
MLLGGFDASRMVKFVAHSYCDVLHSSLYHGLLY